MAASLQKVLTLVIIRENFKILLGYKKRGFGQGKWNGFGGKVEPGETVEEGAVREVREECGLQVTGKLNQVGQLEFTFENQPEVLKVNVFTATQFNGHPTETEEMRPQWYPEEELPFDLMWPDDRLWFPLLLKGSKFRGKFHFRGHDVILEQELIELQNFND